LLSLVSVSQSQVEQEALVSYSIICLLLPLAIHRSRYRRHGQLIVAQGTREQADGVRDAVVCAHTDNEAVGPFAPHAGWAGARLEMVHERGIRDEGLSTAVARAMLVGGCTLVNVGERQLRTQAVPWERSYVGGWGWGDESCEYYHAPP
jgi:hypothetical protein